MLVRGAGPGDVDALAHLRAAWRVTEPTPDFLGRFRAWFDREAPARWWWIAENPPGCAVGMVNVRLFERMPSPGTSASRWGYLANLYVTPAHRAAGIGGALVAAAVERARDEGLVRLVLAPSEQALPLYGRHGFRAADELLVCPLN